MPINDIEESIQAMKDELERIKPATDQLDEAKQNLSEIQNDIKNTANKLLRLAEAVERVDFPTRLGSIDLTMSKIETSLQSIQLTEQRLSEKISSDFNAQREHAEKLRLKNRNLVLLIGIVIMLLELIPITLLILMHVGEF